MVDFPYFKCGSKPIIVNLSGMNIHLPAILGLTRCQGFDPDPSQKLLYCIIIFFQLKWRFWGVLYFMDILITSGIYSMGETFRILQS